MGNNVIRASSDFDTTVINSAVNSFTQDAFVSNQSRAEAINSLRVDIDNFQGNCPIKIFIETSVYNNNAMTLNQINTSSVETTFSTKLTNDISKQFQQQNVNFALGSNVASDATTVSNFIQNTIRNTFTQSLNAVFNTDSIAQNDVVVTLTDVVCNNTPDVNTGEINITSKLLIDNGNTIQIDQVLDAMVKNTEINEILNKYNLTITQINKNDPLFFLSIAVAGLILALIPLIVKIVEEKSGVSVSVSVIKIFYFALMIASAIAGVYINTQNNINFVYSVLISIAVIFFFLLIFFG